MKKLLEQAGYVLEPLSSIWNRPGYGGIAYSDGDETEQRIAAIISHASDVTVLSTELRQHCTDWASLYHLSGTRANILRPFKDILQGDVLEIGAGCGAITRHLGECGANVLALEGSPRRAAIARSRTRDLENVTVLAEKFDQFQCDHQFDVITLIGVLEYANLFTTGENPALTLLQRVRSFLKPEGQLIIAIENQLGLKYFAGAPEDHLGEPMFGIEGRYQANQPQTFGRLILAKLLRDAGFKKTEFLAPFPDYKLPVSILTERGIGHPGFDAAALAWQSVGRDPQLPSHLAFSLEMAWPEIFKNGLAVDMANSFLVLASLSDECITERSVLGYHYSTDRLPEFCKETRFSEVESGELCVTYHKLSSDEPIRESLRNSKIDFQIPAFARYLTGVPLSYQFIKILNSPDWTLEEIYIFTHKYLCAIQQLAQRHRIEVVEVSPLVELPDVFFDLMPQNIIEINPNHFDSFDLEWTCGEGVTLDVLLFRGLFVSLGGITSCAIPNDARCLDWKFLIQQAGANNGISISDERYAELLIREIKFRETITGRPAGVLDQLLAYKLTTKSTALERDSAVVERDSAVVERDSAVVERDSAMVERDSAVAERDSAVAERDSAVAERDSAVAERDSAVAERDSAVAERDSAVALANLMTQSASWRLTRPLRFSARLVRYGLTNQDRQRLTQALRHRYHRLPLPGSAKSLARFLYHRVYRKTVRSISHRALPFTQFHAPAIRPLAHQHDKPDYVVWGVIDWHFRHQRPQQLALALAAAGRRIFYISPVLVDDERAGFEVEPLDVSGQLFQIKLFAKGAPSIYSDAPSLENIAQLRRSIGEVLDWAGCRQIVSLVDHPFWYDMASVLPNSRLVYDCMDHHEGFGNNAESLMQLEKQLLSEAELTITTSTWLDDAITPHAKHRALIRNAGEYEHFAKVPDSIYRDPKGRRVIGYYGAIAEWFDLDLVESVARQHPDCSVLLIGADTVNARSRLAKLHNVTFTGEVPYSELPHYLHGFDVCLLPFKVIPLTLATNPVKAYEYLGAGKPVVAVDLPEMVQFDGLVYAAEGKDAFLAAVSKVLSQPEPDSLVQRRKAFAEGQTWQHRAEALIQHAESAARDAKVSVIVVTYNNIELTRACLESLDEHSQYEPLEIIVVDNASSDGTPVFLSEWVANGQNRRLILNDDNRGFAAANNQGLAVANGEYLVLLNNDTYVTPGWIRTLVRYLQRDKTIGLIGPVTNNIGNEAKIDIAYEGMGEMRLKSAAYTRRRIGQTNPLRTAAFFCVMMPRTTYERVGTLDEAFGRGFFEDDDYCRRVEQIGLRVVCAEDVFIHHQLSASFDKLKQQDRQKLFQDNKKIYEAKWGAWVPHAYKDTKS